MSATPALASRSWPVGSRTVTLTIGAGSVCAIEWDPCVPERLTTAELAEYRAGRNAAIVDIARELGIRIALVDL